MATVQICVATLRFKPPICRNIPNNTHLVCTHPPSPVFGSEPVNISGRSQASLVFSDLHLFSFWGHPSNGAVFQSSCPISADVAHCHPDGTLLFFLGMRCFRTWCCLFSGHWTSLVCYCRPVVLILVVVRLWAVWCFASSMHLLSHTSSPIAVIVAFHFHSGFLRFSLCKGSQASSVKYHDVIPSKIYRRSEPSAFSS